MWTDINMKHLFRPVKILSELKYYFNIVFYLINHCIGNKTIYFNISGLQVYLLF